jgi:hypothetical protein
MRNGRPKPIGSLKGGDGEVATDLDCVEATPAAKQIAENALQAGSGIMGAGGATIGEQHTQWSSGRLVLRKPTPEGPCRSKTATTSEPHEFIGAVGSHRS